MKRLEFTPIYKGIIGMTPDKMQEMRVAKRKASKVRKVIDTIITILSVILFVLIFAGLPLFAFIA